MLLADEKSDYEAYVMRLVEGALWYALAVCALGVLIVAAKIVMGVIEGNPQREAFGLLWVMGGCLLAVSATAIVSALV
ncbi:hypothetical protein [Yinghuangia sp. YIM S09857]|uniref:hypothetical protein n=1 Tax=Yinghuangia sp. YIM S09857 TaxID=3436929 RepID=UPI003F53E479